MFALAFDRLQRSMKDKHPETKLNKLVTAQTGTPDFETYITLFLADDNDSIHMQVEDDKRTYTFFTITHKAPEPTTPKIVKTYFGDNMSAVYPRFKIIKESVFDDGGYSYHIKLSAPKVGRKMNTREFYEVDHVIATSLTVEEPSHYEETLIVGSDLDGKKSSVILYQINRKLTLEEAMFALGELKEIDPV